MEISTAGSPSSESCIVVLWLSPCLIEETSNRCGFWTEGNFISGFAIQPHLREVVGVGGGVTDQLSSRNFGQAGCAKHVLVANWSQPAPERTISEVQCTLRASLSGTFLQTLPDLVTPLKTGSLYLRAAVQRRGQHPPKGSGTNMTVEAT